MNLSFYSSGTGNGGTPSVQFPSDSVRGRLVESDSDGSNPTSHESNLTSVARPSLGSGGGTIISSLLLSIRRWKGALCWSSASRPCSASSESAERNDTDC